MKDSISAFILQLLEKKSKLPPDIDPETFNYIDTGYIDSLELIKFISELEARFDIEITESDLASLDFKTVGGLASLVENKINRSTSTASRLSGFANDI